MLLMNQTPDNPDSSYPPNSYLSSEYLEWFSPEELKFRWTEALRVRGDIPAEVRCPLIFPPARAGQIQGS
jgi:hypothetical protein